MDADVQADLLQRYFNDHRDAQNDLARAERAVEQAKAAERVAGLRYKRQALWIRADELRKTLAQVEHEAAAVNAKINGGRPSS